MQAKTFANGNVDIHYVVGPPAGPPLILLHGVTARWQSFLSLIPFLLPYWQVYALDFRGHGRSGRAPGRYRVSDYSADVQAFIQQEVKGPAFVLGHSLGGRVAIQLALTAPDLMRAIVVGDTPLSALSARGGEDDGFVKTFAIWHTLIASGLPLFALARALGEVPARPGPDGKPRHFKDFWDQAELLYTARCLQRVDPDVLIQISQRRSATAYEILERIGTIACPVLFLQGEPAYGALMADADLAVAQDKMAQSTAVTIAGTGHNLHRDQPVAVAQAVHSFLSSIATNGL